MKMRDLSNMFQDPSFQPLGRKPRWEVCFPNSIYYNQKIRVAVLVSWQSSTGVDFSLRKTALDYVLDAEGSARISQGYVVVANGTENDPRFVNQATIHQVWNRLRGFNTVEGEYGEYWWVTDSLEVKLTSGNKRASAYPQLPF